MKKEFYKVKFCDKGSVLITLIVTMVIFAILAAIMYSLTSSSIFGHLHTLSTTRATYLAKSGYNYLASQYKNEADRETKNLALANDLHDKTFQLLNNEGSFHLNVKPYYLISQQNLTIDNTNDLTLSVKFPGEVAYTIPASGVMSVYTSSSWRRFYYTSYDTISSNNYSLHLANWPNPPDGTIDVSPGTSIVPVLETPNTWQTLTRDGNLTVTGANDIYPARFGFFEIPEIDATHVYYYNNRTGDVFSGIRDAQDPERTFNYVIRDRRIYAHPHAEITSTGTYNLGVGPAVSNTFGRTVIFGFQSDPHNIPGVDGWVTVDTGVAIDTGDEEIQLGRGQEDTTGAAWYAGNSSVANCEEGKCDFGTGIRAFFQFIDYQGGPEWRKGDGFVFVIMNGTNNDVTKRGGTPSGTGMGELLGYAGAGNTADGLGLQPPKIGIEFDRYENSSLGNGCSLGERNDADDNHISLMFWGDNTTGNCSGGLNDGYPAVSYDDNIHAIPAVGTSSNPRNSFSGDGTGGYNWPDANYSSTQTVRVEITRATTANGNGNYDYNIQLWLWRGNCDGVGCGDLSIAFTDTSDRKINRTVELASDLHSDFDKMIFGFTQATGSATQRVSISNFDIYFSP